MNVEKTLADMIAEETAAAETTTDISDILGDLEYPATRDLMRVADPYAMVGEYLDGVRGREGDTVAYYEARAILRRVLFAARTRKPL